MVTGGAGFIGSAVVRHLVASGYDVVNVDKLTYSGSLEALRAVESSPHYRFYQADICDRQQMGGILADEQPDAIMHLAAETHVDRSIDGPAAFVETNIVGTFRLLDAALEYWRGLDEERRAKFRFHHISTDEVFGELELDRGIFTEETPYAPSSPYSASKASSDHLVRAWHVTYGLPVVLTNCSNNYGPFHFPEKLIPLTILNARRGQAAAGLRQGRERARLAVRRGSRPRARARATEWPPGRELQCRRTLGADQPPGRRDDLRHPRSANGRSTGGSYRDLITFVPDRPGHDLRYAIDSSKIERELGWRAEESFETGLEKTVRWFLDNEWWWRPIREQKYAGQRLGSGQ